MLRRNSLLAVVPALAAVGLASWSIAPGRPARRGPLARRTGQIVRFGP